MPTLVIAMLALCALSGLAGVLFVRRVMRSVDTVASPGKEVGLVRVRAEIRAGVEQVLVALARELGLPRGPAGVQYGGLFIQVEGDDGFVIRTSSAIDRGLIGPLLVRTGPERTEVTYSIVRLPQDEGLHEVALEFELRLIAALRRIDPSCSVRLAGTTLRDLESGVGTGSPAQQRATRR